MAGDEQLVMVASVVDKFSANLRELRGALKGVHDDQAKHGREQIKTDEVLNRNIKETTRLLREGMAPALSAVGITTTSLAGAVAAVGAAAFNVAGTVKTLNILSQQTGASMRDLRALEELGKRVNITPEQMQASFGRFADVLEGFKQRTGPLWDYINARPLQLSGLLKDLQGAKGPIEGLDALLRDIEKLPANIRSTWRRELLGAAGLPGAMEQLHGQLKEKLDEIAATQLQFTGDNEKRSAEFRKAWEEAGVAFKNLGETVGLVVVGPGAKFATWLTEQINAVGRFAAAVDKVLPHKEDDPTGAGRIIDRSKNTQWWHGLTHRTEAGVITDLLGAPRIEPYAGPGVFNPFIAEEVERRKAGGSGSGNSLWDIFRKKRGGLGAEDEIYNAAYGRSRTRFGTQDDAINSTPSDEDIVDAAGNFSGAPLGSIRNLASWLKGHAKGLMARPSLHQFQPNVVSRGMGSMFSGIDSALGMGGRFYSPGVADEQKKITKEGTYEGVIQALREMSGATGSGGMIGAGAFGAGSMGGFRPRGGTGGLGGSGSGERFGIEGPDKGWAAGMTPEKLAAGRAGQLAELGQPGMQDAITALAKAETGGQGPEAASAFIQSLSNRALARGHTLAQEMSLHSQGGYYPWLGNPGAVSDKDRGIMGPLFDKVFKNAENTIGYGTGNASGGVGFAGGPQTAHVVGGKVYPGALGGGAIGGSGGHIGGFLDMMGTQYKFGSGGAGFSSIPPGNYPITPGTIGPWGQAHGALGINNNAIWDKSLGRMRQGIEFHAGMSDALITEGCMAIAGDQWPQFKSQVMAMIAKHGSAYLHVGRGGAASVTPSRGGGGGSLSGLSKAGGDGSMKVSGGANLSVDFKNMPQGTRTWLETHGIFDTVELNKGRTNQKAAD